MCVSVCVRTWTPTSMSLNQEWQQFWRFEKNPQLFLKNWAKSVECRLRGPGERLSSRVWRERARASDDVRADQRWPSFCLVAVRAAMWHGTSLLQHFALCDSTRPSGCTCCQRSRSSLFHCPLRTKVKYLKSLQLCKQVFRVGKLYRISQTKK